MTDDESTIDAAARPMSSVRFANALLDNIGASISVRDGDEDPSYLGESNAGQYRVTATWDEVVNNPLAIGLEDDMRRMGRAGPLTHEDVTYVSSFSTP